MGTETNKDERNTPEYLAALLKDKKQIQAFPNVFIHLERLLDEEINKVRVNLFHLNGASKEPLVLPDPAGPVVTLSEKLFVPQKEHPEFNFVGRILGPRGMTAKQLEQDTGCKIMVRGQGSMRDKKKEQENRGKPNWEHLNEELHVLITVEDSRPRAEMKLKRAMDEVKKLLVPAPEGEDDLKKRQLMELAIINGTYRDTKSTPTPTQVATSQAPHIRLPQHPSAAAAAQMGLQQALRSPTPAGAPLMLAPGVSRLPQPSLLNGAPPPLVSPTEAGLLYSPYDYPYTLAPALLEYPGLEHAAAGH